MQTGGEPQHHGKSPASSEAFPWDSSSRQLGEFDLMPHHQKRQGLLDAACPVSSEASPWDASSEPLATSHHHQKESSGRLIRAQKEKQNSKHSVTAQLQEMEALAKEHNIDMSDPENAKLMTQLFPRVQSRMLAQSKANKKNKAAISLHVSVPTPVSSSQSGKRKSGPMSPPFSFSMQPQQESQNLSQVLDNLANNYNNTLSGLGMSKMQNPLQSNYSSMLSYDGGPASSHGDVAAHTQKTQRRSKKDQLHAPKAIISSSQFAMGSSSPNPPRAREIMGSHDAMFPMHSQPESAYLNLDLGNPSNNNIQSTLSGSGALHQLNPSRLNYSSLLSDGARISPQGSAYLPISNSSEFGEIMMGNNPMFPTQAQEESPSLSQLLQNISNYNMNSALSGSGTGQMQNAWQPNHSTVQSDDGRPTFLLGDVAAEMGGPLSQQILQVIPPPPLDRLPSQPAGTSNLNIGTRGPNSQPDSWEWYF